MFFCIYSGCCFLHTLYLLPALLLLVMWCLLAWFGVEGHRGMGDDLCCPGPDLMLGRHCMPMSFKWCFPLPCLLPVADKCCHVSLACLKEIFLLCSKDETTIESGISSEPRTCTSHRVRVYLSFALNSVMMVLTCALGQQDLLPLPTQHRDCIHEWDCCQSYPWEPGGGSWRMKARVGVNAPPAPSDLVLSQWLMLTGVHAFRRSLKHEGKFFLLVSREFYVSSVNSL